MTDKIESAVKILLDYAKRNGITSLPDEIVEAAPEIDGFRGVAVMWNQIEKRTAVKFDGSAEEAAEIRRQFEARLTGQVFATEGRK